MDRESNQSDGGQDRPRTVLPPRRTGAPRDLSSDEADANPLPEPPVLPDAAQVRVVPEGRADGPQADGERAESSRPPIPPRPAKSLGRRIAAVILAGAVPLAMFLLVMQLVSRLDVEKSGAEEIPGGVVHWMADGLIVEHHDPDSEKVVYYLLVAPQEAAPHVELFARHMNLVVRTGDGTQNLSRSVDWDEAPYAMLIQYLEFYGETPKVPCTPAQVKDYLARAEGEGTVAPLLALLSKQAGLIP